MKLLMSLLMVIAVCNGVFAATADSVSQFGIIWKFDRAYEAGQFVNGDWWVVPQTGVNGNQIKIISITKPSGMAQRDGSMLNPMPSPSHGYDGRVGGYNAALDVSARLPNLLVGADSSLISTISRVPAETVRALRRPAVEVAAVLTVLSSAPPAGSFRPAYAGTTKPIHSSSNLQTQLLLSLAPVTNTASLASVEAMFEKPWIDHVLEWQGDDMHPYQNMSNYGGGISRNAGDGALRLLLNEPLNQKQTLLIRYIQLGIDNYGLVANGGNWGNVGGTIGVGRKFPILFAGVMLGDTSLQNVAKNFNTQLVFQEDGQTFYLTQAERDVTYNPVNCAAGPDYCYNGYYDSLALGSPQWGERHYKWSCGGYNYLPGKLAYLGLTHKSTTGTALAVRLLGMESLWNYPAFLDWTDQSRAAGVTGTWGSAFADTMWTAYRSTAAGVSAPAPRPGLATEIKVSPNPARGQVRFNSHVGPVSIFDHAGKLVREIAVPGRGESAIWDGTNAAGQPVGPGVYLYRTDQGQTGRMVRLK